MRRTCIAVVDASRARLLTFERTSGADGLHDQLVELRDLVDPGRRLRPSQLFSDSRPGSSRTGGLQYAFDDHRRAHLDAMDAGFAREIVGELKHLLHASSAQRLILCASPRMLGVLRELSEDLHHPGLTIEELPRDLVKLTVPELRDHLASYGFLPELPARPGQDHHP